MTLEAFFGGAWWPQEWNPEDWEGAVRVTIDPIRLVSDADEVIREYHPVHAIDCDLDEDCTCLVDRP